jgi:hypothetical protein
VICICTQSRHQTNTSVIEANISQQLSGKYWNNPSSILQANMTYHRRVPLLLRRFHLQNLPATAGNRIHSEEQPACNINQLHLPHRAFLRQPNGAWWTTTVNWELLHEIALSYRPAAVASTAGFCFQCLNGVRDSPWWPWSTASGAQDGKSHYESSRPRRRWGEGGFGWKSKGGEITRQRRVIWEDSRANEVMSKGRVPAPRKGENHVGMKKLCGIQPKTGVWWRWWRARPLAKDAEREKQNSE